MIGESNKRQRSADSIAPLPQPDPLFLLPTDLEEWLGTADGSQTPAALDLFDQVMEAQNELAQSNPQPVPMGNAGHSQGQTWPTRMGSNAAAASDAYSWNYASGRDANPPVADSMYGHRGMAPTFGGDSMVDPRFGESSYHTPSGAPAPAEYPYADLISNKFASLKLYQSIDGKGHVWKGSWNGIVVAVKMIKVEQSMEADVLRRFKKLTHILDGIEHPNICKYFGNTMHQGHPFMVHEFIGGGSLHSFLHGSSDDSASWLPALPPRLLSRIALETASAVAYLHSKGVLHRNIKAASVLLDDDQHVKLADFGLSTTLASDLTAETGTYRWMAPEVIGHRKYDDKCDVHSYGMLLWELTHRKIPFQGRGALQAAFAVVQGERPPISLSGELQPFGNVIESCWQHLPTARPNMAKVVTMVQAIDDGSRTVYSQRVPQQHSQVNYPAPTNGTDSIHSTASNPYVYPSANPMSHSRHVVVASPAPNPMGAPAMGVSPMGPTMGAPPMGAPPMGSSHVMPRLQESGNSRSGSVQRNIPSHSSFRAS